MKDPIIRHYDKITDKLMVLGQNVVLRFNVSLGKLDVNTKKKYDFHHEYEYQSNKYIDIDKLITIKRDFVFFLSIEEIRNLDGNKEYIMITIKDILLLRKQMNLVTDWFTDAKYKNLFAWKGNKLIILGNVDPIHIYNLGTDKYLAFEPIVILYNEVYKSGVRMYLSSNEKFVDMPLDTYMGFLYLIQEINMYEAAQVLLNYIKPPLGTNLRNMNSLQNDEENEQSEGFIKANTNRKIPGPHKKEKSFFDRIDDLK